MAYRLALPQLRPPRPGQELDRGQVFAIAGEARYRNPGPLFASSPAPPRSGPRHRVCHRQSAWALPGRDHTAPRRGGGLVSARVRLVGLRAPTQDELARLDRLVSAFGNAPVRETELYAPLGRPRYAYMILRELRVAPRSPDSWVSGLHVEQFCISELYSEKCERPSDAPLINSQKISSLIKVIAENDRGKNLAETNGIRTQDNLSDVPP